MDGDAEDAPVTLVIRSTNQDFSDQTIHCFQNWTVAKLKSHLSDVYPRKPRIKDQRLIYSGKLLEDHWVVKDVLRKDEYYILHLICSTISDSPKPSCKARENTACLDSDVSPSDQSVQPSTDERREAAAQQANVLSYHQWYAQYRHSWYSQRWIPPPYCNTLMLAWWQQMYAQQHFHQALAAQTSSPTQNDPPIEETHEEVNNAWPEWACTSLFGAVLLGVFFFFTSFNHFFLVVMAVLFLYLHEAGWLGNELMIPGDNLNENLPNHDLPDLEQEREEQREISVPHVGYLSTAWSFVSNFFMSLIPAGTPHAAPQEAD